MMKRWPSRSPSLSATMRAVISALPPAPNGNTIRTGRSGNAADAGIVPSASAATQSVVIFTSILPHIRRRSYGVVVGDQLALSNKALHVFIVPQSAGPACVFDRTANAPYSRASVARTPTIMNVVSNLTANFTTEDIEYQKVGGDPLLAKLYRPHGTGPFPSV